MLTLTLDGYEVDPPADFEVALTFCAHDLRSSSTREAAFSETATLPKSHRNSAALGTPHALSSQTDAPYQKLPAVLRAGGVPVLDGVALLESSGEGYDVTLYSQVANLFAAVGERRLRELNLSADDHAYAVAALQAAQGPGGAYTYPLMDDGRLTLRYPLDGVAPLHYTDLAPAVFGRTLLEAIVAQALPGYGVSGSLLSDATFARYQVLGGALGPQRRKAYLDAHTLEALTSSPLTFANAQGGQQAYDLTFAQVVRDPGGHLAFRVDGSTQYATAGHVADYRVQLTAEITYQGTGGPYAGTQRVSVVVAENDLGFREEVVFEGAWPAAAAPQTRVLRLDFTLPRSAGPGQIRVQAVCENQMQVRFAAGARLLVTPGPRAYDNSPVHLDAGLPDWSQAECLQLLLASFNAVVQVDAPARTVRFDLFNDLERNRARAVDWSAKLDRARPPVVHYRLDGLAARNTFAYADAPGGYDELPDAPAETAALLVGTDATLPAEAEAYAAPAAELRPIAALRRTLSLAFTAQFRQPAEELFEVWRPATTYPTDYYVLDQGRYWQAKQSTGGTYPRPGTDPASWRLVEESAIFAPADPTPFAGLYTVLSADVRVGAGNGDSGVALAAGIEAGGLAFADLLPAYYPGTTALLARVRWLEVQITLSPSDIANLDHTVPVALNVPFWPGVGPVVGLFYVNRVDQWAPGQPGPTTVELIRMGEPVAGIAPAATPLPVRPERLLYEERGLPLHLENTDYLREE